MNINLSAAKKKKKENLRLGLNSRGTTTNVLGGSDSSSSEDETPAKTSRAAVNQAVKQEQAALRQRAQAALEQQSADIYDYDGAYDSFQPKQEEEKKPQDKKSRYIGDLLKAAQVRERERDVIRERKIAQEQAAEDEEYGNKDKFVTAAYKRKLQERELWQQEEEKRQREEEVNDVTKRKGGLGNFYSNLSKNVALGGGKDETNEKDKEVPERDGEDDAMSSASGLGFLQGFEPAGEDTAENQVTRDTNDAEPTEDEQEDPVAKKRRVRAVREEKVAQARIRYFQRQQGIAA